MGSTKTWVTRAVLDTNVVISALVFEGTANRLVAAWQDRRLILLVSKPLLEEHMRVLHYPRLRLSRDDIRHLVEEELLPFITPVKAGRLPRVIRSDPSDNAVLACATSGKAALIVSGDHHLLDPRQSRRIPIIRIPEFLQQVGLSSSVPTRR